MNKISTDIKDKITARINALDKIQELAGIKNKRETAQSIIEWNAKTFPDATRAGQMGKFLEERTKFLTALRDGDDYMSELADMFIVGCGCGRFDPIDMLFCMGEVWKGIRECDTNLIKVMLAINAKMNINRKRRWKKSGDGSYKHVK